MKLNLLNYTDGSFRILLDIGCSLTIAMVRLVERLGPKKDAPMQWNTQAGNIRNNIRVKIDFTLPALSMTNVVT